MFDKLLSPFVGYWYWAQDRATPLSRALAMGAPLVVFGLVLYMVFGRSGDDASSLVPDTTGSNGNIAVGTQPPEATQPAVTDVPTTAPGTNTEGTTGAGPTGAEPTAEAGGGAAEPAPTAFTQGRYTVVSGDTPEAIADKVGVPDDIQADWIQEMLALNGVTATTLQVDQELILPPF